MTVDLTEATLGQDGQIIITGEDGQGMLSSFSPHPLRFSYLGRFVRCGHFPLQKTITTSTLIQLPHFPFQAIPYQ